MAFWMTNIEEISTRLQKNSLGLREIVGVQEWHYYLYIWSKKTEKIMKTETVLDCIHTYTLVRQKTSNNFITRTDQLGVRCWGASLAEWQPLIGTTVQYQAFESRTVELVLKCTKWNVFAGDVAAEFLNWTSIFHLRSTSPTWIPKFYRYSQQLMGWADFI